MLKPCASSHPLPQQAPPRYLSTAVRQGGTQVARLGAPCWGWVTQTADSQRLLRACAQICGGLRGVPGGAGVAGGGAAPCAEGCGTTARKVLQDKRDKFQ